MTEATPLERHEAICSERYGVIHDRLNSLSNRMWAAAVGVLVMAVTSLLGGLGTILVFILTRGTK